LIVKPYLAAEKMNGQKLGPLYCSVVRIAEHIVTGDYEGV
jgi:hypothetical protein